MTLFVKCLLGCLSWTHSVMLIHTLWLTNSCILYTRTLMPIPTQNIYTSIYIFLYIYTHTQVHSTLYALPLRLSFMINLLPLNSTSRVLSSSLSPSLSRHSAPSPSSPSLTSPLSLVLVLWISTPCWSSSVSWLQHSVIVDSLATTILALFLCISRHTPCSSVLTLC